MISEKQADEIKAELLKFLNNTEESAERLENLFKEFESLKLYRFLKNEEGKKFKDMSEFCEAEQPFGLSKSQPEIGEIIRHRFQKERERIQYAAIKTDAEDSISPGRYSSAINGSDKILLKRAEKNHVSKRTQIKLDRLAREFPDLHQQVRMGLISANQAMIEAGLEQRLIQIPANDPLKAASKIKEYYPEEQIERLIEFLKNPNVKKTSEVNKVYKAGKQIKI